MKKIISLTFHTERLHSDSLWKKIEDILRFFDKHNIKATWFSINPTFVGYKAMGFDEKKWEERLKFLKDKGQEIQQHTHFYKGKEGVKKGIGYDLEKENVRLRFLEDRQWLREKAGIDAKGFISGAWQDSQEIKDVLKEKEYRYNLVSKDFKFGFSKGVLEIPNYSLKDFFLDLISLNFKRKFSMYKDFSFCTLYLHDYDLERCCFNIFLKILILILIFLGIKFISVEELYKKIHDYR